MKKLNLVESNYRTLNLILSAKLFLSVCRLLRLNLGARGEYLTSQLSQVTAWLLLIRVYPVCLADGLVLVLCAPPTPPPRFDWADCGSVDVLLCMLSAVLVLWGVGAILGNGYDIKGQHYIAILQEGKKQQNFTTGIGF